MLKDMESHLWVEHREGSGPLVPHNSPTHKRKSGSNASAKEAPIDVSQALYDRKAGGVSRKMGVSQPAREKKKERAKSNINSLNHQFVSSGSVFVIVGYKRPIEHMHTCIHTHACTDTRQMSSLPVTGPTVLLQRGDCEDPTSARQGRFSASIQREDVWRPSLLNSSAHYLSGAATRAGEDWRRRRRPQYHPL